jgi:hypothetical protein
MKLLAKVAIIISVMPVFGNLSASIEHCSNRNHNHNHCVNKNCGQQCKNHCHSNSCHVHHHCHRPRVGFSLNIGTPIYEPPVRVVERSYYRPETRVVKTYSRPVCESTTYRTYGRPYSVCETKTVYSSPVAVYETVEVEPVTTVYETVEYRRQHPISAALNFAGAMIDAFAD